MELVVDHFLICVHCVEEVASVGELNPRDLRLVLVLIVLVRVTDILQWLVH